MFRFIDKVLAVFVFAPPLYMLFRFVRWWMRQDSEPTTENVDESTAS